MASENATVADVLKWHTESPYVDLSVLCRDLIVIANAPERLHSTAVVHLETCSALLVFLHV